ncbi:MAG: thioredoxin domain-containing protein [Syntrophorhabdaceae bacterium]|nr:thioredoxin domain-containing protein [Syntrophorhabdaceae bacterium]
MNRLSKENSPYLRHASEQKIDWYPWCEEAFERARAEDKPVFLSSGAMWCHWCHVMAKESFEDDEVAEILNKHFISIKLDRDERPDIDRYYQNAVSAMTGKGGWPLSVFLTPDKKPFYGGTYFPLNEKFGILGFKTLLKAIIEVYQLKKDEIKRHSEELVEILGQRIKTKGVIDSKIISKAVDIIMDQTDTINGGFGVAPKFPMPGAIEFLLNRYYMTEDKHLGAFLIKTLSAMAKGGIYDHIGGGFHRYSTDSAWIIPHFEKIIDDNVWLLRNYLDAYSIFKIDKFKEVASGIINFIMDELTDTEGGFYTSQDADVTPDDEGGYFTWTEKELKEILDEQEYIVISKYFMDKRGSMHHDHDKKVLFEAGDLEEVSKELHMDTGEVLSIIKKAKQKLFFHRSKRQKPTVDKTKYSSLNGMAITAFFKAYHVLNDENIYSFAFKSLDRIIKENTKENTVFHSKNVKGFLSDYINLADACMSAYEASKNKGYLERADAIMGSCIEKFWDKDEGGFFYSEDVIHGMRLKGIDDSPHPSPNAQAIILLLKLSSILKSNLYRKFAEDTLSAFINNIENMGIYAGYFFNALDFYFNMLELTIHADTSSELKKDVIIAFYPYKVIAYSDSEGFVQPCLKGTCYHEMKTYNEFLHFLLNIKSQKTQN